ERRRRGGGGVREPRGAPGQPGLGLELRLVEGEGEPRTPETIAGATLETDGGAAATIPFRVRRVSEDGVQVLEREGVRGLLEDGLEGDGLGVTHPIVVVVLPIPLNDEPTVRRLTDDGVIDVPAGEEI